MNIPEYAKIVRVNKKNTSTILGEHFDANILLYEILTIFGISGETHSIALDTSRASNGMIRYSNDMAYLYGFSDTRGYDSDPRHYGVGSPYKWAKKKGPILVKQRKGQLN